MLGLGSLLLLGVGSGTALDYLIAQSYPVTRTDARLLRAEYTVAGIGLLVAGVTLLQTLSDTGFA